ncbi:MAG TPA: hypothetical protein VE969_00500, partial [Pyrinomonadaceae bacterium]|nr:hypothetical protein [Pyrinomonadaceae bacterium]
GMIYQRQRHAITATTNAQPSPSPVSTFAGRRAAVDADPQKWLIECCAKTDAFKSMPEDSKDPEFLYLYGRARMLLGDSRGASEAFERALANIRSDSRSELPLETEVQLANAAAALKQSKSSAASTSQESAMAEQKAIEALDSVLGTKSAK